jgi:hypothetical protein
VGASAFGIRAKGRNILLRMDAQSGDTELGRVNCPWSIECEQVIKRRSDMRCHNVVERGGGG